MISNSSDARKLNVLIDAIARERSTRGKGRPPRRIRVALPAVPDDAPQVGSPAQIGAITFFPPLDDNISASDPMKEIHSITHVSGPDIAGAGLSGARVGLGGNTINL